MNSRTFLALLAFALSGVLLPFATHAADDTRLTAELIWGTNGGKPPGKNLKEVSPQLERQLRRVFKWQNYFEINRKEIVASLEKPARVEMSRDCVIEVAVFEDGELEVQLFGKGQLVVKKRQRIVPGEKVVLGGDDKNDDAWFVVLSLGRRGSPPAQPAG